MPDAHMRDSVDRLVGLGAITRRQADEFLAHRQSQRLFIEDAWRRADDLDSESAEARRHELRTIIKALGWELGIDIP